MTAAPSTADADLPTLIETLATVERILRRRRLGEAARKLALVVLELSRGEQIALEQGSEGSR